MADIVYKSGGKSNEYLIILGVNPDDTNLKRTRVVNKDTAKFRCRKAFVVDIQHKDTGELVDSICSNYNPNFIYKRGEYIEEPAYNTNINIVCSKGIHFFTTKEPAFLYKYIPKKYNGIYQKWHDNGQLKSECEYKNGVKEGPLKSWYENGQFWEECVYKNGKREGPLKSWYFDGQLEEEYEYKNGVYNGLYKGWNQNGQLWIECRYKNGKVVN